MLYITEAEVRQLLPMKDAIRMMRLAFEALGKGEAQNHARRRLALPTGSVLHSLAGAYGEYFGTKVYSTNPKYGANFVFLLYDAKTARPLALMEANYLGQIRTGAASGYATDLMANPEAKVLGVIGSGYQAATQVEAMRAVRPISDVRVWSRTKAKAEAFAHEFGLKATGTAKAAVTGADIVVTATNAKDPVFESEWIQPGTHINAMGSNISTRRELPAEIVRRADTVVVDSMEQAKLEAGDLILADHWMNVVELKDVHRGYDSSRITIFESLGLGLEDVAAGGFVYEAAIEAKVGRQLTA